MRKHFEHMSPKTRERIAFSGALVITALIGLAWFAGGLDDRDTILARENTAKEKKAQQAQETQVASPAQLFKGFREIFGDATKQGGAFLGGVVGFNEEE